MDPVSKAEALAQRALQRSAVEKQAAAEKRAETWQKIQQEAPQIAELLTAVNHFTGRPNAVTATIGGQEILSTGEFDKPSQQWDGKIRKLPDNKPWRR